MKIPFFWLSLGFAAGIVAEPFCKFSLAWAVALFFLLLPVLWLARGRKLFLIPLVIGFAVLGLLFSRLDYERPDHAVERWGITGTSSDGINLDGTIKTPVEIKSRGRRVIASFVLDSERVSVRSSRSHGPSYRYQSFPVRGQVQVFLFQPAEIPEFGDKIRLWGTLEKLPVRKNPGEFDYGQYLSRKNIHAIFRGLGKTSMHKTGRNQALPWIRFFYRFREKIAARIDRFFDGDTAVVFKALIVGTRRELSSKLRDDFMKTGTSHLLAISGLNVSLVAGSFFFLLKLLGLRQKPAAVFALIMVISYVFIAGAGIPVCRSGWMIGSVFMAMLLEREGNSLNFFFFAFLMLLIVDTHALKDVSFQLSFLSVFALIWILPQWPGNPMIKEMVGQTGAAMVGTFPLALYYFNLFSAVNIFANLIAVPLFHLALLTALTVVLFGPVPFVGMLLAKLAHGILSLGLAWISFLARAKWGFVYIPSPSIGHLIFYYAVFLLFFGLPFFGRKFLKPLRLGFFGIWVVTTASFFRLPDASGFSLTLLSGGKNELMHLQSEHSSWLMNAGRSSPSNQAQWLLNPYLRSRGIKHLRGIFLSDFYRKHTGGLQCLMENFVADLLFYPEHKEARTSNALHGPWLKGVRKVPLKAGDSLIESGNLKMEILGIAKGQAVSHLVYLDWDFLLLPALTPEVLAVLEEHSDLLPKIEIVLLPSLWQNDCRERSWMEKLFSEKMDPRIVTLPHVDPALSEFLRDRDIPLLEVQDLGALTFQIAQRKLEIRSIFQGKISSLSP